MYIPKCEACRFFDCGFNCNCRCHHGGADKIRQDHNPADIRGLQKKGQKSEDQAMEGLSSLFG